MRVTTNWNSKLGNQRTIEMGAAYTIFGKTVQPHVLALLTLGATVGGAAYATAGSKTEAQSKDSVEVKTAPAASTSNDDDVDIEKLLGEFLKEESK